MPGEAVAAFFVMAAFAAAAFGHDWKSPSGAAARKNPLPSDAATLERGHRLYANLCAECAHLLYGFPACRHEFAPRGSCVLCGCGSPRSEELQLKAIAEGLDRGGTPRTTHVEVTEKPDTEWLEYATHDEAQQVLDIVERCRARMPVNDERNEETVS